MKSLLSEWGKFKGWRVLSFFLERPEDAIHIKGLSKELGIGPGTANLYLNLYLKEGLLKREKSANAMFFRLAESPLTLNLKKTSTLLKLNNCRFVENVLKEISCTGIALYGSHATGLNDGKSDLDVLIISREKKLPANAIKKLEDEFGKEANATIISLSEWRSKIRRKEGFSKSILEKHIVLYGSDLVE